MPKGRRLQQDVSFHHNHRNAKRKKITSRRVFPSQSPECQKEEDYSKTCLSITITGMLKERRRRLQQDESFHNNHRNAKRKRENKITSRRVFPSQSLECQKEEDYSKTCLSITITGMLKGRRRRLQQAVSFHHNHRNAKRKKKKITARRVFP